MSRFERPDMSAAVLGDLIVNVSSARRPTEATWRDDLVFLAREAAHTKAALTFAPGQPPDAGQRKQLVVAVEAMNLRHVRVALLTESTIGRGSMIALHWLSPGRLRDARSFAPDALEEALAWVMSAWAYRLCLALHDAGDLAHTFRRRD
jgi:hypothetical protein